MVLGGWGAGFLLGGLWALLALVSAALMGHPWRALRLALATPY